MRDLRVLDPVPPPAGPGMPTKDWHQTPTRVPAAVPRPLDAHRGTRSTGAPGLLPCQSTACNRCLRDKTPTRATAVKRRKPGARLGLPDSPQVLLEPTASVSRFLMRVLVVIVGLRLSPGLPHASGHCMTCHAP